MNRALAEARRWLVGGAIVAGLVVGVPALVAFAEWVRTLTAPDLVMLAYWIVMVALIVIAVAYALWFSGLSHRPAARESLDCMDGKHLACDGCEGCACHRGGVR
ncbi:hypothetical protein [Microbacterium sp. NPDC058389]|uniref:hypothetical protein n=1 Tax=Microbacterium sp. NPDC058389 TaxID=3346475 RepID=UPI003660E664